jgi:AmmeMemoRadiSam system protein B/AmmeMemoRadiSam system protein A
MIILSIFSRSPRAQNSSEVPVNRKAYAAGKFYAGNAPELKKDLVDLFTRAKQKEFTNVQAIVVPHAGFSYSGLVAASGYNQIDTDKEYDHIFVIASSHTAHYDGASIYNRGNYDTPLGEVEVDLELSNKLIAENKTFSYNANAHITEHSLEVQLPFLQYLLKKPFKIIPIVIGTQEPTVCQEIAKALRPYFNKRNLFVISTDFSHFPKYEDACELDKSTAEAVVGNDKHHFLKVIKESEAKGIPNLATAMCGWNSVLTLLNLSEENTDYEYKLLQYMNSGDADNFPDKGRVVGYYSIVVTDKSMKTMEGEIEEKAFQLSDKDKADLLGIARLTMEGYVRDGIVPKLDTSGFSENIKTPLGAFVTLFKDGELRGCIGAFEPEEPLFEVVQQKAIAASTRDHRFLKVKKEEFDKIELEISVLTPMKKIRSADEIVLGRHGIYIKKGSSSGTFLPQVATETGWDLEQFLGHCARDKARIGWDGWKTADIYIYEAHAFHE